MATAEGVASARAAVLFWPTHASRSAQPESDAVGAGEGGAQVVEGAATTVLGREERQARS